MPAENPSIKTTLSIQLRAGDTVVAESTDSALWQRVLAAITGAAPGAGVGLNVDDVDPPDSNLDNLDSSDAIGRFAADIGVPRDVVQGAFSPSNNDPFIHLDNRRWEAFQKNVPNKGRGSVPSIVLAGTALAIWWTHAKLEGRPTQAQAGRVLDTIHVTDKNPSRGIANCDWLLARGGGIVVNPAETSKALALLKAYCLKEKVVD